MHTFDEMKAYVRFDDDDARRLRTFWAHVSPRLREITGDFYDRILEFDGARAVLADPRQVIRLKRTMEAWLEELLLGPYDTAYVERRRHIGTVHVKVGLPHRYMFTAMEVMQEKLCAIAREVYPLTDAEPMCGSIHRVTMLDLALMTGTYMGTRERERIEDLAGVLVSHLPTAAMLLDRADRVAAATDASLALCGADLVGRTLWEAVPRTLVEAAGLRAAVQDAHASGREVNVARVDADVGGAVRSFRVSVVPLQHEQLATIVQLEEITASLAEGARQQRLEALAQLGELSAAVAHELRNPLAGISGAVQVISGSLPADDRRRPVMDKVKDQIMRLDRMVRDLLTFSRTPELRAVDVSLGPLVDGVLELVRREPGVASLVREGDATVRTDPDLVHRVVLNLVQNAAAAAGADGHVVVDVSEAGITVSDDGPGVPAEHRDRLFEPFFTTRTTGTGLGLAICQNAAHALGGRLELLERGALGGAAFRLAFGGGSPG